MTIKRLTLTACALLGACGDDGGPPLTTDAPVDPPATIAKGPSKSGTIAVSDDHTHVAMVNPEDGTLAVFQTSDNARTAKVATGASPSAVVIAPNNTTAYVANRADGTVVRITGLAGGTPTVDATVKVGAEPTALALSPTGKLLFVAEYAQSRVSVIDTSTMAIVRSLDVDRPRTLLVTNNLDASDADETLVVPQFFGTPVAGKEARDDGRTGVVRLFNVGDPGVTKSITLAPTDSGFAKGGVAGNPTVRTSPNQLGAVALAPNGRLYITSVSASPEGPTRFDNNVFPVVYVADLASATEVVGGGGTTNLARKIVDAIPAPTATNPRFIPGDLSDIAFLDAAAAGDNVIGYALGKAGDVLVRTAWGATTEIGSTQNKLIDLAGNDTIGKCQGPTGIAIDGEHGLAYINCWVTRRM
ncbi:MAG: YncE family protein, partial [Proteobacteria bacterium]|nr:YncE family protein [Pseudomonadota bacterium]